VTELTDDQFAALCAGIGNSKVPMSNRLEIEPLLNALEKDAINRRIERMTTENIVDVTSAFVATNLGSDELFNAIHEKVTSEELAKMDVNCVLAWGDALLSRDRLSDELVGRLINDINGRFDEVSKDKLAILAEFIIKCEATDQTLLSNFVKLTGKYSIVPITKFYKVQQVKHYLQIKYPDLITADFIHKCDAEQVLFQANRMPKNAPMYMTHEFEKFFDFLTLDANYKPMTTFTYQNVTTCDFGWMP
jgi:hypothetical protein